MLPIPPLDGSRLLPLALSEGGRRAYARVEQYGLIIILGLMFLFSGVVFGLIEGPVDFLLEWVVGL